MSSTNKQFMYRTIRYTQFFLKKQITIKPIKFIKAMFVFRKVVSGKSLSKFSCVCLPLEKLVNGNTFRSTKNTFQSKKNLVWFPGKCFSFWLCLFSGKWFPGNHFPNFPLFVCHQKSRSTENTFQSKENLAWFSGKCFPGKFRRKTLSGSCENLEM